MKRIVSLLMSVLIVVSVCSFTSVVFSAENPVVLYELRPSGSEEIPFGKGRVNDCYYPDAEKSGLYSRPEMYPFGTCELSMDGGFRFSLPGKASTEQYHLDYIGFFSDKTTAETYSVMATEGESVSKLDTEKIEDDFKIVSGVDEENTAVFYNMRVPLGEEIPFGKGRVNDCYFPDAERTGKYNTPEMYPFGSCELTMEGGFVKMKPKAAQWSNIVFDTVPKELYINDYNHRYLTFMV